MIESVRVPPLPLVARIELDRPNGNAKLRLGANTFVLSAAMADQVSMALATAATALATGRPLPTVPDPEEVDGVPLAPCCGRFDLGGTTGLELLEASSPGVELPEAEDHHPPRSSPPRRAVRAPRRRRRAEVPAGVMAAKRERERAQRAERLARMTPAELSEYRRKAAERNLRYQARLRARRLAAGNGQAQAQSPPVAEDLQP